MLTQNATTLYSPKDGTKLFPAGTELPTEADGWYDTPAKAEAAKNVVAKPYVDPYPAVPNPAIPRTHEATYPATPKQDEATTPKPHDVSPETGRPRK